MPSITLRAPHTTAQRTKLLTCAVGVTCLLVGACRRTSPPPETPPSTQLPTATAAAQGTPTATGTERADAGNAAGANAGDAALVEPAAPDAHAAEAAQVAQAAQAERVVAIPEKLKRLAALPPAAHPIAWVSVGGLHDREGEPTIPLPGQLEALQPEARRATLRALQETVQLLEGARRLDGSPAELEDWLAIEQEMVGYEEWAFAVARVDDNDVTLRPRAGVAGGLLLPRARVRHVVLAEELAYCQLEGADGAWTRVLLHDDLKTPAPLDLEKPLPGDPARGVDAIGVLRLAPAHHGHLCPAPRPKDAGVDGCVPAEVAVDPAAFRSLAFESAPVGATGAPSDGLGGARRPRLAPPRVLGLHAAHFLGPMLLPFEDGVPMTPPELLLVYDHRADGRELLLQSILYNKPKVWVTLPDAIAVHASFHPLDDPIAQQAIAALPEGVEITPMMNALRAGASIVLRETR